MKLYRILYLLILSALLLAGCENPMEQESLLPTEFTATIELDAETKTTLGSSNSVLWSSGDQIAIGAGTYTVNSGIGSTTANFTGSGATETGSVYKAYYPKGIYNSGTPTLPATQNYVAGRIDNLPMYAQSTNTNLPFRNLCAVLHFSIKGKAGDGVTKVEVVSKEKALWGSFNVVNNAAEITATATAANRKLTLNCQSRVPLSPSTPTDFYVAIPHGTYKSGDLTVLFYDGTKVVGLLTNRLSSSADQIQFVRNNIYKSENDDLNTTITATAALTVTPNGSQTYTNKTKLRFSPNAKFPAKLTINWGDGTPPVTFDAGKTPNDYGYSDPDETNNKLTHIYSSNGTFTVTITAEGSIVYPGSPLFPEFEEDPDRYVVGALFPPFDPYGWGGEEQAPYKWNGPLPLINSKSVSEAFQGHPMTSIPEKFFANNPQLENFSSAFEGCGITSVPVDLFKYCPDAKNFHETFRNYKGTTVPADLFRYNTKAENFGGLFCWSSSFTSIPVGLFQYNTNANDFSAAFQGTGITSVPVNLFQHNTKATKFNDCFMDTKLKLTSASQDLFRYNTEAKDFAGVFFRCAQFDYIPPDLFRYNTKAENFSSAFQETAISVIPTDLFRYNTAATHFGGQGRYTAWSPAGTFQGCENLTAIPADLFKYNTAATHFRATFAHCISLTAIPATLFTNNGNVTDFRSTFESCSSVTGAVPALWTTHSSADGEACFRGVTGASNYSSIPAAWR